MKLVPASAAAVLLVLAAPAAAVPRTVPLAAHSLGVNALEVSAFGGYGALLRHPNERGASLSRWNGGGAFAGGVTYRSPYFLRVLSPFFDIGYYPLYRSRSLVDLGALGGDSAVSSSLAALGVAVGWAADLGPIRVRAGLALYDVLVTSSLEGAHITASELDGGYLFSVSGSLLRRPSIEIGAELRLGLIVEADLPFVAVGSTVRGKAISW